MQITTLSTNKTKPNLQVKAKKSVYIASKLLLLTLFGFFTEFLGDLEGAGKTNVPPALKLHSKAPNH